MSEFDDLLEKMLNDPELSDNDKMGILNKQICEWERAVNCRAFGKGQVGELSTYLGQLNKLRKTKEQLVETM